MPVLPQQYSEQRAQFSEVFNLRSTELHFCFVSAASASMLETRPINKSPTPIYCPKSLGSPFLSIPEKGGLRTRGRQGWPLTRLERVASLKCSFTLARFSCIALCALNYCRTASFSKAQSFTGLLWGEWEKVFALGGHFFDSHCLHQLTRASCITLDAVD